ncbi:MAG: hypothetical protein ACRBB4_16135 [Neptuniibacter sp.]
MKDVCHWQHEFPFLNGMPPLEMPNDLCEVELFIEKIRNELEFLKENGHDYYSNVHWALDSVQSELMTLGVSDHDLPLTEDYLLDDVFSDIPNLAPLNSAFESLIRLIHPNSLSAQEIEEHIADIQKSLIELYKINSAIAVSKSYSKKAAKFGAMGGVTKGKEIKKITDTRNQDFLEADMTLRAKHPSWSNSERARRLIERQPNRDHPLGFDRIRKLIAQNDHK